MHAWYCAHTFQIDNSKEEKNNAAGENRGEIDRELIISRRRPNFAFALLYQSSLDNIVCISRAIRRRMGNVTEQRETLQIYRETYRKSKR